MTKTERKKIESKLKVFVKVLNHGPLFLDHWRQWLIACDLVVAGFMGKKSTARKVQTMADGSCRTTWQDVFCNRWCNRP